MSHMFPTPQMHNLPMIKSPTSVVHFLQSMNLHQHILITQSPLGFTLSIINFMGLDKASLISDDWSIIMIGGMETEM